MLPRSIFRSIVLVYVTLVSAPFSSSQPDDATSSFPAKSFPANSSSAQSHSAKPPKSNHKLNLHDSIPNDGENLRSNYTSNDNRNDRENVKQIVRTKMKSHLDKQIYETIKEEDIQCRDRYGTTNPGAFRVRTCVDCFKYILMRSQSEFLAMPLKKVPTHLVRIPENKTLLIFAPETLEIHKPDIKNMTSIANICQTLTRKQCQLWRQCCENAVQCCDSQNSVIHQENDMSRHCPGTWDGYACWEKTSPGTMVETPCPDYVSVGVDRPFGNPHGVKTCQSNGTWFKRKNKEWTDYRPCLNLQAYKIGLLISLATNGVSILLLIPAIIIFTSYRLQGFFSRKGEQLTLRRQHRIKVHSNFFVSLLLCAVCSVLWDILITYDMLNNQDMSSNRMSRNPAGCRALSALKIYFSCTNYFWMFCEGYYLHRLLSDAFRPPENLISLYIIGWVLPAIPVFIYCIVRLLDANESCWVYTFGQWNMLYYIPNMLCLGINMLFLCNILRVITTRIHQHPNEPSNFRKGLKAIFILIPLFGLQLFVTIYRPPKGSPGLREYDTFHSFITNSQGFFVAILFCFFNHEVMNHMRFSRCCRAYRRPSRHHSYAASFSTDNSTLSFRGNSCHGNQHFSAAPGARNGGNSPRNKVKLDKMISSDSCRQGPYNKSPSRTPILAKNRECVEMTMSEEKAAKPMIVTIKNHNALLADNESYSTV